MEVPLFQEILVIFALSLGVLLFCHRLNLPSIVGFLFTGILCGPHALGLVHDLADVQELAEIGIVLLLFTVGMEFSIKKIAKYKRFFFGAGLLQVGITTLVGLGISRLAGISFSNAVFIGFLLTLSSTAIVMRLLDESRTTKTPHGRLILGTLIFQDIAVVPMMLSIPVLAGVGEAGGSLLWVLAKGLLILTIVFLLAERIAPRVLYYVAKTRSRELFLLGVLLICFSVALLVSRFGLSVSIGAFLAGLTIAETEYRNKAIDDILPFKDIFTSFFFVSIGMLLDVNFLFENILSVVTLSVGVVAVKALIMLGVGLAIGMPLRTAILAGIALAQVGEFSFVLAESGVHLGMGSAYTYQLFLAVAILSMAVAPSLVELGPRIVNLFLKIPFPNKFISGISPIEEILEPSLENHLVIVGYGLIGKNLARSCEEASIPYTVVDIDAELVRKGKKEGVPINYGDATHESTLLHVNIKKAQVIVILVNDTVGTLRMVESARKHNENIYVIVRTHYLEEMKPMFQLGADDVIVDEFGSAVEIYNRVLQKYNIPHKQIERLVHDMRQEGYEMVRLHYKESAVFSDLKWNTVTVPINEGSPLVNKTLIESAIRKNYGVSVIAIKRSAESLHNIDPHTKLFAHDLLVVMGSAEGIEKFKLKCRSIHHLASNT